MITEESFLDFRCPYCGDQVSFPQPDAGHLRACPNCNESVLVPADGAELGGKPPLPVSSERLLLRRFLTSDWEELLRIASDEELFQYSGGGPLEEEEVLRWLERDAVVKFTTPNQPLGLGIQLKEPAKLVGYINLTLTGEQQAGFNIFVGRPYQRQSIGLEAVDALLGFCFEGIKLHRVFARCDSRNVAAAKLLDKVGMRREGEFIKDTLGLEGWLSTLWYAALEEEFLPQQSESNNA